MISLSHEDALAAQIRACLLDLLAERGPGRTICPSEAAHLLAVRIGVHWEDLMRPIRVVATALAEAGLIEATQHETVVDIRDARGPVRLRLLSLRAERVPQLH